MYSGFFHDTFDVVFRTDKNIIDIIELNNAINSVLRIRFISILAFLNEKFF